MLLKKERNIIAFFRFGNKTLSQFRKTSRVQTLLKIHINESLLLLQKNKIKK